MDEFNVLKTTHAFYTKRNCSLPKGLAVEHPCSCPHSPCSSPESVSFRGKHQKSGLGLGGGRKEGRARTRDASASETVNSEDNPQDVFQCELQAEGHTVLSKASMRGFGVGGDLPFCLSNQSTPLGSPGCSGRSQHQHQQYFPAKMKENSLQPHKTEKVPKPSLDALRDVSSDQMNVQAAPESTTGTGCSPEHRAQLSYLDPQLVFWRESIKFMYFLKNQAFCKLKQFELGRCDSNSFPFKHQRAQK